MSAPDLRILEKAKIPIEEYKAKLIDRLNGLQDQARTTQETKNRALVFTHHKIPSPGDTIQIMEPFLNDKPMDQSEDDFLREHFKPEYIDTVKKILYPPKIQQPPVDIKSTQAQLLAASSRQDYGNFGNNF